VVQYREKTTHEEAPSSNVLEADSRLTSPRGRDFLKKLSSCPLDAKKERGVLVQVVRG
jgi:hypothetical protein